jgi:hypothetical protein
MNQETAAGYFLLPGALGCHSRESGKPVIADQSYSGAQGLLDCPVKPGNDTA